MRLVDSFGKPFFLIINENINKINNNNQPLKGFKPFKGWLLLFIIYII